MFEGCVIGNRVPFIEAASRKVFEKVGIETSEAPFTCCPDPTGLKSFDNNTWLTLGALNLCIAEAEGKNIISSKSRYKCFNLQKNLVFLNKYSCPIFTIKLGQDSLLKF